MKYRLLGAATGIALVVGLFYGLEGVVPSRYAIAVAMGVGTGAFLVLDGSAGAGEGWIYHRVRSRAGKLQDASTSVGAGVLGGFGLAMLADLVVLGELGATILVGVGALLAANFAFLYRRPTYEQQLEEMEE